MLALSSLLSIEPAPFTTLHGSRTSELEVQYHITALLLLSLLTFTSFQRDIPKSKAKKSQDSKPEVTKTERRSSSNPRNTP